MAVRQRTIVQGRIENGTLFPQISAKILLHVERLTGQTFSGLEETMATILNLANRDLDMAEAARTQAGAGTAQQADLEAERRKEEFLAEIDRLKKTHEAVVTSIAAF
jgi:hypothetical protein